MSQKPFRFTAYAILAEGTLYPHLTALEGTYKTLPGSEVVMKTDQNDGESQEDFMFRIDGEMRKRATQLRCRYADNVLTPPRKAV